jgi:membrane-anchored mycosin MYCP
MTNVNRHRGWVETFERDQLVVALPDLPAVTQALGTLDVRWEKTDQSEDLGMALLVLDLEDIAAAVRRLRADDDGFVGQEIGRFEAERAQALPRARPHADLDLLIRGIRAKFARQFPGWEVTIGKNYGPSLVKGYPHTHGGGNGDPQPTEAPLSPPVFEHRDQEHRGRGIRVGLLDTHIFPDERLTGHYIAAPTDVLHRGRHTYTIFDGHCAFVASCILQQAPAAELYVRSVLDQHGDGSAWKAAVAVAEFARLGLDVVNLSFGEFLTDDNSAPMVLEAAVKRLGPETVVVAAAGNNGDPQELTEELVNEGVKPNSASYPAALPDVVGVGALDKDGKRAAFTPDPAPWIALLAPGVGLVGSYVRGDVMIQRRDKHDHLADQPPPVAFGGKAAWEGCSFAAGIVSGEIAARTRPGRRSARQALDQLLSPDPGKPRPGIMPNPDNRTEG